MAFLCPFDWLNWSALRALLQVSSPQNGCRRHNDAEKPISSAMKTANARLPERNREDRTALGKGLIKRTRHTSHGQRQQSFCLTRRTSGQSPINPMPLPMPAGSKRVADTALIHIE
ncbi:hypothetical protein [Pararhizobium polonicum]|uniref:hypothetical protein n=1 Tax=Pararhizobium polonicum TaxID=1612624 RepID=UPI00131469C0|nr:hypothetical protein [Pararhizobium polonicum]